VPSPAAPPGFATLTAPAAWQVVDFISDLHLSDETPATFDAWAHYMNTTAADAVFILGDLFEAWVGDDARSGDFEARCVGVLSATASTRRILFMAGNRDFLVGQGMCAASRMQLLSDPTVLEIAGHRLMLSHGDELCIDDVEYQQFRSMVRSPSWQSEFLSLPLQERRRRAALMREQSRQRQKALAAEQWIDIDTVMATQWLRAAGSQVLIHGHTHRPQSSPMSPGLLRHVLSDWDLDHPGAHRAEVLRWQDQRLTRVAFVA
jgi:UDP-2,3-diacylglucosamine hydrolase